jgi:hypothetical protein
MRKHDDRSEGLEVVSLRKKSLVHWGGARREGFSLVLVLLIAIIGSAILGSVVYMIGGFAGGSRATMRGEDIYVQMQDEIERAKAALKLEMNKVTAPSDVLKMSGGTIDSLDDLIIHDGSGIFAPGNVNKNVAYGGKSAELKVRIFDMLYPAGGVDDTDSDLVASLPPCMESMKSDFLTQGIGVYLIRATLTLDGDTLDTIETSVIQSIGGSP